MHSKEPKLKYPWRRYKGKRILNGYVQIWAPGYKRAKYQGWCNGYISEHTLIMQGLLGRLLKKGEVVHHVDGNRLNNEPTNLQLMTGTEHRRHHISGKKKTEEHKKKMSTAKKSKHWKIINGKRKWYV